MIEKEWNISWFRYSKGFWLDGHNQRVFLDSLAKEKEVLNPKDWISKTKREVYTNRATSLLSKYGGSLFETLKTVYSGFSPKMSF